MANPLRGEATFVAGESEYTLVFDINTLCDVEAETGLDLNGIVLQVQTAPRLTLLRTLFCAGLQTKHPGTSKLEAGRIMSDAGAEGMTAALRRALHAAMPEAKEGGGDPPTRRRARTA